MTVQPIKKKKKVDDETDVSGFCSSSDVNHGCQSSLAGKSTR